MEEVYSRTFFLVAVGLLVLSFFSYQAGFGTGQVTAAGSEYYDCNDVDIVQSRAKHQEYDVVYDLDKDHDVDEDDVDLVKLEALKHPCPDNECLEVGRTRCDILGNLVTCELNEYGKKVEVVTKCPGGWCVTKQRQYESKPRSKSMYPAVVRTGECEEPFRGTPY